MRYLLTLFIALAVLAGPAFAEGVKRLPGNVTIKPSNRDYTKSVVIRQRGQPTVIIRTDPDSARLMEEMLKKSDRTVIRVGRRLYYPQYYYPYYKEEGTAYSAGHAVGTILSR
ncbi:MAG: hypothetical protein IT558_03985 [Alphaproteobacteria bacterium]|nr:hypothetical protein [Alphaproteobacteria bacterium]